MGRSVPRRLPSRPGGAQETCIAARTRNDPAPRWTPCTLVPHHRPRHAPHVRARSRHVLRRRGGGQLPRVPRNAQRARGHADLASTGAAAQRAASSKTSRACTSTSRAFASRCSRSPRRASSTACRSSPATARSVVRRSSRSPSRHFQTRRASSRPAREPMSNQRPSKRVASTGVSRTSHSMK